MRFIKVLLIALLVFGPVSAEVFAKNTGEGRSVASAKKTKKGKAAKGKKAKKSKAKSGKGKNKGKT